MHATGAVTTLGIQGVAQTRKKQYTQNNCVGEQCDNRGCDCDEDSYSCLEQSQLGCKDQESIQLSTTPDPGYQWESDKLTVDTTNKSQEVSPFPAGDHKAHINRRAQNIANTRQNKNIKDPQKKVPPWNGQ